MAALYVQWRVDNGRHLFCKGQLAVRVRVFSGAVKGDSAHVSVCLCVSVVSVCLYIC